MIFLSRFFCDLLSEQVAFVGYFYVKNRKKWSGFCGAIFKVGAFFAFIPY